MAAKTALITGGTGALGQEVVQALAAQGDAAVVPYIRSEEWERLAEALGGDAERVHGMQGDVTSPEFMESAVQAAVDRFGRLDALFHLVGGYTYAPLADTTPELWQRMISLNLTSAYVAARAALPALTASRGVMVFVTAQAALRPPANQVAYNAAKAGVVALVQTLAAELRDSGVRVNAIAPEIIDTPANRKGMPNANFERWLQPAQVADALLYLLSDRASGVTGAVLTLQRA
jgi:NAD(P)-dependent dehydrogenase (short-subunit alcohol dehydrogenase family)